jgi:hypothetical protein
MTSMAATTDYTLLGPPEARHAAATASAPTDEAFSSNPTNGNVLNNESNLLRPRSKPLWIQEELQCDVYIWLVILND